MQTYDKYFVSAVKFYDLKIRDQRKFGINQTKYGQNNGTT